jgi:hypothetical protein
MSKPTKHITMKKVSHKIPMAYIDCVSCANLCPLDNSRHFKGDMGDYCPQCYDALVMYLVSLYAKDWIAWHDGRGGNPRHMKQYDVLRDINAPVTFVEEA